MRLRLQINDFNMGCLGESTFEGGLDKDEANGGMECTQRLGGLS